MCRTFSLPEIKQADLFAVAAKSASAADRHSSTYDGCYDPEAWSDDDLMELLDQFPDELDMDLDFTTSSTDDSSVTQSLSDDLSLPNSRSGNFLSAPVSLPTFDLGANFGLHGFEEGFVALPNHKTFSHISYKTTEAIREEKLKAMDPFVGALNEGDLFSLFSICQSQCAPDVVFSSKSCGFQFAGTIAVITFWTLLFEEHYQGRIQCLSRRLSSTLRPNNRGQQLQLADASMFESVEFVLKLEGCRLSEFRNFELFQALMNSGYINNSLSLPEVINISEAFYKQFQSNLSDQGVSMAAGHSHHILNMVYLFEVNLKFHAINHTISQWNFELIAVQSS